MRTEVNRLTFWEKFQGRFFSKSKYGKLFIYTILIIWSISTIFPLVWVFLNSFKPSREIITDTFKLPTDPTLQNYINAFDTIDIGRSYLNSFIMSGSVVFFVLFFGGLAAFVMARLSFRLRGALQTILVMSLLIPAFATIVPVYRMMIDLELVNTHLALIIPQTAGNLPFAILVISGYMATIPKELEEASLMDGCSRWKMFTKVFLPVSLPIFGTVGTFVFLWSYNDLFTSLVLVEQEHVRPIVVLLSHVSSQYGTDYGLMTAAIAMTVVPVIIFYLFAQKTIEKGATSGAVKG
ncbi:MAG: carbohydrate ABC transporter permease [Bacillota bacterium]|uniref:Carbohydrate ABC transporter permease n=1 Tax=Virgibacillus salarius TaxID=447199 RepID=A0A941DUQ0_9BACI|nr:MULTISPECIES: carbohydrate ABC transporter permease [Bacillaceae]NAZ08415.1 ABC transporter permease subunit [Agaribacter marinus]MBR7795702.1 carbohydrate ABC transporter permease [Virgibacillus salarius]MCC2248591.1 carbohydrate ABC transporter permease [Virgibacillus sp. AGTR]MDY7043206.1 carbohydrate ABC transporter permease [Virgibacillus sp. M23]QRZ18348.1 carbohydrate ABC transporter permease [Virgibacillus sp. AGTR]